MTPMELIGKLGYPLGVFVLMIAAAGLLGAACKWINDRRNKESNHEG